MIFEKDAVRGPGELGWPCDWENQADRENRAGHAVRGRENRTERAVRGRRIFCEEDADEQRFDGAGADNWLQLS